MKPANLFLIPDRSRFLIKVLDFGLAKSIREDLRATRTGFLVGSPSYMSPEQVREEAPTVKSDLFCLASVSYELLTGKVAFSEESVIGTLNAILFGTPVPLARLLPAVPDELDTVFSHALAKIPEDRPGSVGQWAGSLLPILARTQTCHPGWDIEKLSSGHLS
jgi:serine/threonine protein kinase